MIEEYKTVLSRSNDEFTEKKSKFIGYVCPVTTQQQALDFINEIKSRHRDATHNVSAYVLRENNIQHSSDDGEPSGTAGVPVLDVLLKQNIVDTCVVVTRYFGGILLGAGGLVRAYSHASSLALDAGGIVTMSKCTVFSVCVDYSFYDRLTMLLSNFSADIENTHFAENVTVTFCVKNSLSSSLDAELTQLGNGKYKLDKIAEKFAPFKA